MSVDYEVEVISFGGKGPECYAWVDEIEAAKIHFETAVRSKDYLKVILRERHGGPHNPVVLHYYATPEEEVANMNNIPTVAGGFIEDDDTGSKPMTATEKITLYFNAAGYSRTNASRGDLDSYFLDALEGYLKLGSEFTIETADQLHAAQVAFETGWESTAD